VHIHLCLLLLTPSPIHHRGSPSLCVARSVKELRTHCHRQERVNNRVKTCQPGSLPICAALMYGSVIHRHQPPARKEGCKILPPGPGQPTTSCVQPRVVCSIPRSQFGIDTEPHDGELSQTKRNAPSFLWFVILQAPWEYHGYWLGSHVFSLLNLEKTGRLTFFLAGIKPAEEDTWGGGTHCN